MQLGNLQALSFIHVRDLNYINNPDSTPKCLGDSVCIREIQSVSGRLQRLLDNSRK